MPHTPGTGDSNKEDDLTRATSAPTLASSSADASPKPRMPSFHSGMRFRPSFDGELEYLEEASEPGTPSSKGKDSSPVREYFNRLKRTSGEGPEDSAKRSAWGLFKKNMEEKCREKMEKIHGRLEHLKNLRKPDSEEGDWQECEEVDEAEEASVHLRASEFGESAGNGQQLTRSKSSTEEAVGSDFRRRWRKEEGDRRRSKGSSGSDKGDEGTEEHKRSSSMDPTRKSRTRPDKIDFTSGSDRPDNSWKPSVASSDQRSRPTDTEAAQLAYRGPNNGMPEQGTYYNVPITRTGRIDHPSSPTPFQESSFPQNYYTASSMFISFLKLFCCFCIVSLAIILFLTAFESFSFDVEISLSGFIAGFLLCGLIMSSCVILLWPKKEQSFIRKPVYPNQDETPVLMTPVEEQSPVDEYEGWMHETRTHEVYDLDLLKLTGTLPVYVTLKGHILTLYASQQKIKSRAMYNDEVVKVKPISKREFDIRYCPVTLLPENLSRKRLFTRKFPICIRVQGNPANESARRSRDPLPAGESSESETEDDGSLRLRRRKTLGMRWQKGTTEPELSAATGFSDATGEEEPGIRRRAYSDPFDMEVKYSPSNTDPLDLCSGEEEEEVFDDLGDLRDLTLPKDSEAAGADGGSSPRTNMKDKEVPVGGSKSDVQQSSERGPLPVHAHRRQKTAPAAPDNVRIEILKKQKAVREEASALVRTAREVKKELESGSIILFARSDRFKEYWFRKLTAASKQLPLEDAIPSHHRKGTSATFVDPILERGLELYALSDRDTRKVMDYDRFMRAMINPAQDLEDTDIPRAIVAKRKLYRPTIDPALRIMPMLSNEDKEEETRTADDLGDEAIKGFAHLIRSAFINVNQDASLKVRQDYHGPNARLGDYFRLHPEDISPDVTWINALLGRLTFDVLCDAIFEKKFRQIIDQRLAKIQRFDILETVKVKDIDLGCAPPIIHRASRPYVTDLGVCMDFEISYEGCMLLSVECRVNLANLNRDTRDAFDLESPKTQKKVPGSSHVTNDPSLSPGSSSETSPLSETEDSSAEKVGAQHNDMIGKIFRMIKNSKYLEPLWEGRGTLLVRTLANTPLGATINVQQLIGVLSVNIPPPPCDRVWVGFRGRPHTVIVAAPNVGNLVVDATPILNVIEKWAQNKIVQLAVLPQMLNFPMPIMTPISNAFLRAQVARPTDRVLRSRYKGKVLSKEQEPAARAKDSDDSNNASRRKRQFVKKRT